MSEPCNNRSTCLHENHGRYFLRREGLGFAQVFHLYHRISALIHDFERPWFDILLDCGIVEPSSNESSAQVISIQYAPEDFGVADLISKIVLAGFIAAWFFADSPINRSWSVKETNEGVVKLPCSLATRYKMVNLNFALLQYYITYWSRHWFLRSLRHMSMWCLVSV